MSTIIDLETDLFYVYRGAEAKELALLSFIQNEANAEYARKGYAILSIEILSHASEGTPASGGFKHKNSACQTIRARCSLKISTVGAELKEADAAGEDGEKSETAQEDETSKSDTPENAVVTADSDYTSKQAMSDADNFLTTAQANFPEIFCTSLPISPGQFFSLLLSDPASEMAYHEARSDTGIECTGWVDDTRTLKYSVAISGPVGPPVSRALETQKVNVQPTKLVFRSVVQMLDAPYGDYFTCETKWVVEAIDSSSSSVLVYATAAFSKSTWLEGTIRKKTLEGILESTELWIKLAKETIRQSGIRIADIADDGEKTPDANKQVSIWTKISTNEILIGLGLLNFLIAIAAILIVILK